MSGMKSSVPRRVFPSRATWTCCSRASGWVSNRLGSAPQRRVASKRVSHGAEHACHLLCFDGAKHIAIRRGTGQARSCQRQHLFEPVGSPTYPLGNTSETRHSGELAQDQQAEYYRQWIAHTAFLPMIAHLLKRPIKRQCLHLLNLLQCLEVGAKCDRVHGRVIPSYTWVISFPKCS
jgi:hypothetical protein